MARCYGIKPAVTALVLHAAWRIGSRALKNAWLWAIAAAAFASILALHAPFPLIVLVAGLVGYAGGRWMPDKFGTASGHAGAAKTYGPALIDDTTPTPAHARFSRARLLRVVVAFIAIWALAIGAIAWTWGTQAVFTRMAWFFTKAALLTFGGAYAVLPYVFYGAVEQEHWLTAAQMIDGLALGETTPGPLIMVVAFVGFVGGWNHAIFGPELLFLAGAAAAAVVTFFTFLPSFFFILLGAPLRTAT